MLLHRVMPNIKRSLKRQRLRLKRKPMQPIRTSLRRRRVRTVAKASPSLDISWADGSLGDSSVIVDEGVDQNVYLEDNALTDDTRELNTSGKPCPTCGEPIIREPGARGRAPKYHPECRPSAQGRRASAPRAVRVSKGEQLA